MIGAVIGDIIGSAYEWKRTKEYDFELFTDRTRYTDDTVLAIATADVLLRKADDYGVTYKKYANHDSDRGYGGRFRMWMQDDNLEPYNSFGNGSAMRVGPVGWAFEHLHEVLEAAEKSAACTHNHPEGIKGAKATAAAVWYGLHGASKDDIRSSIQGLAGYDLNRTCDEIRPDYRFNEICQETVPQAIIAFLDSSDFEDAIRLAVSLGGDADTLGAITGAIAEAFYKSESIDVDIRDRVLSFLPEEYKNIISEFNKVYND